mgnify:CR=1 FL=1
MQMAIEHFVTMSMSNWEKSKKLPTDLDDKMHFLQMMIIEQKISLIARIIV